jgi:phosphoglycerate dehydrogenase-like enzyme
MAKRAGFNTVRSQWEYVYNREAREELASLLDLREDRLPVVGSDAELRESLKGAQILLSTWGARPLTKELLDLAPDLELVVYAAGSVKHLVTPELIERGITVCSAVHLNARPVAEFTLGIILVALKDLLGFNRRLRRLGPEGWRLDPERFRGGYYGSRVGLLGYGRVSAQLIDLLRPFDLEIWLSDPHLSRSEIRELGARPGTLEEVMAACDVVSLHHGDTPENRGMINRRNLALLSAGAHFINTSRGQLVVEEDLVERLEKGDITAYLDVTDPEPPAPGHPFYSLSNCVLTPHIAGSLGREVHRMGEYAVREVRNWLQGRELENPVDLSTVFQRA